MAVEGNSRVALTAMTVALEAMVAEIEQAERNDQVPAEHAEIVNTIRRAANLSISEVNAYMEDENVEHMKAAHDAMNEAQDAVLKLRS